MKLTEKEFETIIEALEYLPNKNAAGSILAKLAVAALTKGDEEGKAKAESHLAKIEAEAEAETKEYKKICGIVTGKLYIMKDELVEE